MGEDETGTDLPDATTEEYRYIKTALRIRCKKKTVFEAGRQVSSETELPFCYPRWGLESDERKTKVP